MVWNDGDPAIIWLAEVGLRRVEANTPIPGVVFSVTVSMPLGRKRPSGANRFNSS